MFAVARRSPPTALRYKDILRAIDDQTTDVVSFDVFDTLLVRPVLEPVDLFSLADETWRALGLEGNFTTARKDAESRAKISLKLNNRAKNEPSLDAIYEELAAFWNLSEDTARALISRELSDERRWLQPRQSILPIFERALSSGKRLIAISDTYHSRDFIHSLLVEKGFPQIERVFVSSQFGETKADGSLYPRVLNELGLEGNKILHIGDNYRSDVVNAGRFGLKSAFLPPAVFSYFSDLSIAMLWAATPGDLSPTARLLLGLAINRGGDIIHIRNWEKGSIFNGDAALLGFAFLGPAMFCLSTEDKTDENDPLQFWSQRLESSSETSHDLRTALSGARAFCIEAKELLGNLRLDAHEIHFIPVAFLKLLSQSMSVKDKRILNKLPPLPSGLQFAAPDYSRRAEVLLLRRFIYQRAFIRLLTSRQAFFRSAKSPLLRAYARWKGIV